MKSVFTLLAIATVCWAPLSVADDAKDQLFLEALMRLENIDLTTNPALAGRVVEILGRRKGTDDFVQLVTRFNLTEFNADLLAMALAAPRSDNGAMAVRQLLKAGDGDRIQLAILAPATADAALQAVGYAGTAEANALLTTVITGSAPLPTRTAAVKAISHNRGGELALVQLAEQGKLPADLHFTAANALFVSSDPAVREAAGKYLEMPKAGGQPLPPISELVKITADPAKGQAAFAKAACIACHRAGGQGIDFGPALTEIGDKLPPEEIFNAILDPSAGISFGYEGFIIKTKAGSEAIGCISSRNEEKITLRMGGGITTDFLLADIDSVTPMKQSLMTPGLQALLSTQEFVDLVGWLSQQKKK